MPGLFSFLGIFRPLAEWLETHCWRRCSLWLKGRSAAVLAFVLVDRFAVTKAKVSPLFLRRVPGHPQGYWLTEPVGTAASGGAHLFSLHHGRRGCWRCAAAVAVAVGARSSGFSSELPLSLLPVAPENADRITSFAKKFFPSLGTIMICSLSDSRSAMIF